MKKAESDDPNADEACTLLKCIRSIEFVTGLLLCLDYYELLKELSEVCQKVDIPVWVRVKKLHTFKQDILSKKMHASLDEHSDIM